MSNFPCSVTRNITSHSVKNVAFHRLFRWKMIILLILTTSLVLLHKRLPENVLSELGSKLKPGDSSGWNVARVVRRGKTYTGLFTITHIILRHEAAPHVSWYFRKRKPSSPNTATRPPSTFGRRSVDGLNTTRKRRAFEQTKIWPWRTWLFITYSDERWLYYQLSLHHFWISLRLGECTFWTYMSERVNSRLRAQTPIDRKVRKLLLLLTDHSIGVQVNTWF